MTSQNSKKMISNTGKLRGALCSAVPVSLIMQLTTQQEVYLLVCLSPSVLAFHRYILVAARFFSAATTRDTALPLPKVQGYAQKCGFAHNCTNGLQVQRLPSHNTCYFYPGSALWCWWTNARSAQLILCLRAAGNPRIAAQACTSQTLPHGNAKVAKKCKIPPPPSLPPTSNVFFSISRYASSPK